MPNGWIFVLIMAVVRTSFKLATIAFLVWLIKEILLGLCLSKKRLDGKVVLITGGNSGIGYETAKEIASRGAVVVLTSRDIKKLQIVRDEIARFSQNEKVLAMELDLGSFQSVIKFVNEFKAMFTRLDILINNAGIGINLGPELFFRKALIKKTESKDGFELMMQVNFLAPFFLLELIQELFRDSSKMINIVGLEYLMGDLNSLDLNNDKKEFNPLLQYGNSKLALALMGSEAARKYKIKSVTVIPGLAIRTGFYDGSSVFFHRILRVLSYIIGKSPWQAAQTPIYACLEDCEEELLYDCRESKIFRHPDLHNKKLARALWNQTIEILSEH